MNKRNFKKENIEKQLTGHSLCFILYLFDSHRQTTLHGMPNCTIFQCNRMFLHSSPLQVRTIVGLNLPKLPYNFTSQSSIYCIKLARFCDKHTHWPCLHIPMTPPGAQMCILERLRVCMICILQCIPMLIMYASKLCMRHTRRSKILTWSFLIAGKHLVSCNCWIARFYS